MFSHCCVQEGKRSRLSVFADRSTRRWYHLCYGKATLNFKKRVCMSSCRCLRPMSQATWGRLVTRQRIRNSRFRTWVSDIRIPPGRQALPNVPHCGRKCQTTLRLSRQVHAARAAEFALICQYMLVRKWGSESVGWQLIKRILGSWWVTGAVSGVWLATRYSDL